MQAEDFYGIYQELVIHLGVDTTVRIHEHLQGLQVTFPIKLYSRTYIEKQIRTRYDGSNAKLLAKEFGYTERYFKKLLPSANKEKN